MIKLTKDWDMDCNLRLLHNGAEIKDDKRLSQYKLENNSNIQIMKREKTD